MDTTNTTHATDTTTCDPRPFLRHMALAQAWCRWRGQRGTERQVLRVMDRLSVEVLTRMLAARGITVA